MVEIANIVDGDSLEEWLDRHGSYEISVIIAFRAAMRVAPAAWEALLLKEKNIYLALRLLRQLMISGASSKGESRVLIEAANAAAFAARAVGYGTEEYAAALAADRAASNYNVSTVDVAYSGKEWSSLQEDCQAVLNGRDLSRADLWIEGSNPMQETWYTLKAALQARPSGETSVDWSFWIDWYQRTLDGTETRWDMLTEIALLDPKIWEGEPNALMDQIYAIWGRHTRGGTPNAEEIKQDPADDLFYSDPLSTLPPDDHGDILDRLKDAVDDVRAIKPKGNYCLATDLADELDKIEDWIARYKDRPLRLYELCIDISLRVNARMHDGALSDKDQDLLAFLRQLERTQLDILNDDEEVARKVRQRGGKRIAKLNDAEKERVRILTDQAASESKPEFAEELTEKAGVVLDDQANEEDRSDAGYELTSRLSRMKQIKREDVVKAADDAAKVNKGGAAAWDLISTVYSWFV